MRMNNSFRYWEEKRILKNVTAASGPNTKPPISGEGNTDGGIKPAVVQRKNSCLSSENYETAP